MTRSLLILFSCAGLLLACVSGETLPGKTAVSEAATVLQVDDIDALKRLLAKGPRPATIRLEPGTYRTLSPLRILGIHGLRLEARGAQLILESPDYNVIEIRDSSQVSIIGIHARHAKPSGPAGCLGTVIQIENSQSVEIAESELDGSGTVGIAAYDAPDLLIRDNHIHHNSAYPVVYEGPSVTLRVTSSRPMATATASPFRARPKNGRRRIILAKTLGYPGCGWKATVFCHLAEQGEEQAFIFANRLDLHFGCRSTCRRREASHSVGIQPWPSTRPC